MDSEINQNGTVVIISPIIVFKMVPEIELNFQEIINTLQNDYICIQKFREILNELLDQEIKDDFFDYSRSHDLFEYIHSPFSLSIFTWDNPQYISIFPKDQPCISQLFHPPQPSSSIKYQKRQRNTFTYNYSLTKRSRKKKNPRGKKQKTSSEELSEKIKILNNLS